MFKKENLLNIKNLLKGLLIFSFLIVLLLFCYYKIQDYNPTVYPPIIKYENTNYFNAENIIVDLVPEGFEQVGKITSIISSQKSPAKDFQCNYDFDKNAIIFANPEDTTTIYVKYDNGKNQEEYEAWKTAETIQKEIDERNKENNK